MIIPWIHSTPDHTSQQFLSHINSYLILLLFLQTVLFFYTEHKLP